MCSAPVTTWQLTHRDIALPTRTLNIGKHVQASFSSGQALKPLWRLSRADRALVLSLHVLCVSRAFQPQQWGMSKTPMPMCVHVAHHNTPYTYIWHNLQNISPLHTYIVHYGSIIWACLPSYLGCESTLFCCLLLVHFKWQLLRYELP